MKNGWSEAERTEQEVGHTSVPCNISVHCQKSSQRVKNVEREGCHQTSSGWRGVQGGLLRKRTVCDG